MTSKGASTDHYMSLSCVLCLWSTVQCKTNCFCMCCWGPYHARIRNKNLYRIRILTNPQLVDSKHILWQLIQRMLPKILSLCSWFVINYLKDQEPKEEDIEYSQTLFAYDTLDIVHIFKANNGTFTTKLLKDDISVQVPIVLYHARIQHS